MREPWDLAAGIIGQINQQTAQSRATADNALLRMIEQQIGRQNAATSQGYRMDELAQRNAYSTAADTTAFERQLQRDNQQFGIQDARRAEDRQFVLDDRVVAGEAAARQGELDHQRQLERIRLQNEGKNGGVNTLRRYGSFSGAPAQQSAQQSAPTSSAVSGGDLTLDVIRGHEGFRERPYWDVNALRTGYGSDTVTHADGRVEKVGPNTRVTRADAERDLARRTREFQNTASAQVGQDVWRSLSPGAHAALTSVAYNYGSLPRSVVAAAKSGDPRALAQAIAARGSDNNGINARRRQEEAALVLNGSNAATASGPRRHYDQGEQQDVSNAILAAPVQNSTSQQMNELPPVSDSFARWAEAEDRVVSDRVRLTEAQMQQVPFELKKDLYTDLLDDFRNNGNGPTEYIYAPKRSEIADVNTGQAELTEQRQLATQPPANVEIQQSQRRVMRDGRMVLEDGADIPLVRN